MNQIASRTTEAAQKNAGFHENLEYRKNEVISSEYFTNFPVIILACSNYIWNIENDWQISNIFNVDFEKEYRISKQNRFYTHFNQSRTRLVIHTRQLSMAVKNELLIEMASIIKSHLHQ
jgi:Gpi18-like mannosyltransferase